MSEYHDDALDRMAVGDALAIIGDLVRDGLPLVAWDIYPYPGRVEIGGHAGLVRGGASPAEVIDTVRAYAEYFGVEAEERTGQRQDSLHAVATVRGIPIDVWGVTAFHHEEAR